MWYNRIIRWVIDSPLHPLLSNNMLLITVVGCKTGRTFTFPVNYLRDDNTLYVLSPRSRFWWRNLRDGATVTLMLRGKRILAHGRVIEDDFSVMDRFSRLFTMYPHVARMMHVPINEQQEPNPEELRQAANEMVVIELHLGVERFTEEFQRVLG